jgi:hypothetical protein
VIFVFTSVVVSYKVNINIKNPRKLQKRLLGDFFFLMYICKFDVYNYHVISIVYIHQIFNRGGSVIFRSFFISVIFLCILHVFSTCRMITNIKSSTCSITKIKNMTIFGYKYQITTHHTNFHQSTYISNYRK